MDGHMDASLLHQSHEGGLSWWLNLSNNWIHTILWLCHGWFQKPVQSGLHFHLICISSLQAPSDAVDSHANAFLLEDEGQGQGQGTKKKKKSKTRDNDKGGQGTTTMLDKAQWWVWGQWGWGTSFEVQWWVWDYQDEGQWQKDNAKDKDCVYYHSF